jgi:hypothetical protein
MMMASEESGGCCQRERERERIGKPERSLSMGVAEGNGRKGAQLFFNWGCPFFK